MDSRTDAVVAGDLFFVDPKPMPGQESPERGARLDVRLLEKGSAHGSIYAARPILVDKPFWRADLLGSADGPTGSFDPEPTTTLGSRDRSREGESS